MYLEHKSMEDSVVTCKNLEVGGSGRSRKTWDMGGMCEAQFEAGKGFEQGFVEGLNLGQTFNPIASVEDIPPCCPFIVTLPPDSFE